MTLVGRVAVVTGASRGIGAAIAERLGAEGATVAVVARSLSSSTDGLAGTLADTAARIAAHGSRALPVAADLTDPDERARVVETVVEACGLIDILVNAAGRALFAPISGFTADGGAALRRVRCRTATRPSTRRAPASAGCGCGTPG